MFNTIKKLEITKPNTWTVLPSTTMNAFTASETDGTLYGAYFQLADRDGRYLLMIKNTHDTNSCTVKLLAGDGIWAGKDVSVTLTAGQEAIIQVESGRHKFTTADATLKAHNGGTDPTGCLFLTSASSAVKACMFHTVL